MTTYFMCKKCRCIILTITSDEPDTEQLQTCNNCIGEQTPHKIVGCKEYKTMKINKELINDVRK